MSAVLRPRGRGARGKKLVVLGAASVAALALAGVVFAYLSATVTSGSHGRAVAGTVGAPAGPTVPVYSNNGQVTVTWGAATLGNNHPVLGYYVTRTNASNVTVAACGTNTATLTSSTSCTDGSGSPPANITVPDGTYTYNVTAAYHLWGTAASSAGSVIVDTAPPTSTLTFPNTAGPFKASSWTAGCNVAPFSATNAICGTAADVGSGVSGVGVSIQSTSGPTSGMYWGGSSFNQATETGSALRAASSSDGFAHWTLSFPAANLPDGTFTVRVHAIDAAGNNQAATTAQSFSIDNTAPVTTDNAPAAWQNSTVTVTLSPTDPIVNGSHSGVASTYYTTDGTSPSVVGGVPQGTTQQGTSVVLASEGNFTIKYFSVDSAGNQESVETAANPVRIDKTNPTAGAVLTVGAYIGAGPTTFVKTGQALTDTVANDPTSGGVASGVASVTYYYCSVATDGAGCTPSHSIGSSSTGSSYSVSWDSHLLANGDYRLMATVADNAGNAANTVARTVTVDNAAPTTSDNSATIGTSWFNVTKTVTLSPTDNAGGSGVATTYYTDGSSTPTTSSSQGTSIALSTDGVYSVKYFSVDNLGNQESVKTASTAIHIDKTAPTPAAIGFAGAYVHSGTTYIANGQALTDAATDQTINGASSGIASVHYYYCAGTCTPVVGTNEIGTGSTTSPSYSVTWSSQPADGTYSVLARVTDVAGNGANSSVFQVAIDNTKPSTTDNTSTLNNNWKNTNQTVTLSPTDPITGGVASGVNSTYYTSDGSTPTTSSSQGTAVALNGDGLYTVKYFSADNVGNQETVKTAGTVIRLDETSPTPAAIGLTGAFVSGGTTYILNGQALTDAAIDPTVNGASSGVASIHYYYCAGSCTPVVGTNEIGTGSTTSPNYSVTWSSQPADGVYSVMAHVTDVAGNSANSAVVQVTIDNTKPTINAAIVNTTTNLSGFLKQAGTYVVYAEVSDSGSGVNTGSVTANVSGISGGAGGSCPTSCTALPLTFSAGGYTVNNPGGGTSVYHYKSATVSAQTTLTAGSTSFTATARDNLTNSGTTGTGTSPAASVTVDNTAPIRSTLQMLDVDGDGKVDQVVATYNEGIAPSTDTTRWALSNVPSGGTLSGVSTSGTQATLAITEGAGAANTAVGTFNVAYAIGATGVTDYAGNQAATVAATAPTDKAAPVATSMTMQDTNSDGRVDHVSIVFSESLAAYTAGTAPWTLANVPSGGSLSSVAVSGTTATLTLSPGAGAQDTSVGAFTVALATSATGVRDAGANLSSFAATAPSDGAGPVLVSAGSSGGASNLMQAGDTMDLVFSEALASASVPSSATVSEVRSGTGTLTIPGVIQSASIANGYLAANSSSGSATGTITLTNGGKTIHIVLGTVTTTGSGVATGSGGATLKPATTITDTSGLSVVTTVTAACSPLF